MNSGVARVIAHRVHAGQLDRFGEYVIEHVERVAQAVPDDARPTAYLHDVLEVPDARPEDLLAHGLTRDEFLVLELLTRRPNESYRSYVRRISRATGEAGRLARIIKRADLDDHLGHLQLPACAPNYAWAKSEITSAQERNGETAQDGATPQNGAAPTGLTVGAV
jgi:hypothetical protein